MANIPLISAPGYLDLSFNGNGKSVIGFSGSGESSRDSAIQPDGKIVTIGTTGTTSSTKNFAIVRSNSDGSLDTSFGTQGIVITSIDIRDDNAVGLVIQPDSKIIVVGDTYNGSRYDFAIVRYNSDGSLDTSFSSDGIVTTIVGTGGSRLSRALGVALQSDGKFVVTGYCSNGVNWDIAVVRYNSNGTLDTTFDSDGIVTTAAGANNDYGYGIAIQTDGKIVIAGESNNDIALLRYNADGSLDTTFDSDGIVNLSLSASTDTAFRVALQPDGKIVTNAFNSAFNLFAIIRFNPNGSLDPTFDNDGIVISPGLGVANSFTLQPDGKIVAVGSFLNATPNYDFVVVRYNPNGSLDTSFDSDGIVITPVGTRNDFAYSAAIQANGKIVVTGAAFLETTDFTVVRYNSDGSLDATFDNDGKVFNDLKFKPGIAKAVAIQADGKIVVGGYEEEDYSNFGIVRYNPNGKLDTTFGNDGKIVSNVGIFQDSATSLAIQSDGKILAAGKVSFGPYDGIAVIRYNQNGSLDTTFDTDGVLITQVGTNDHQVNSMTIQPDGKILIAGGFRMGFYETFVVRLNTDGSFDTTFDTDGFVFTSLGGNNYAYSVAVQTDGKIIIAANNVQTNDFAVIRYQTNGGLDATFGTGGIATTAGAGKPRSIAFYPDGKILVAGFTGTANSDFSLVRYNTNGTLDTGFDTDGKVTTSIGSGNAVVNSMVLQTNGKIVVAGTVSIGSSSDFAIARYNNDGSLDNSLPQPEEKSTANSGIVTVDVFGIDKANSVAIDSLGKIVVVGEAGGFFGTIRLQADGLNLQSAGIRGKVVNQQGRGISRAFVTLTNSAGQSQTRLTLPFGDFRFENLSTGENYTISVKSKSYQFLRDTQTYYLVNDLNNLEFVGYR
jgi:uncharacterized delta-60 repeat protein